MAKAKAKARKPRTWTGWAISVRGVRLAKSWDNTPCVYRTRALALDRCLDGETPVRVAIREVTR